MEEQDLSETLPILLETINEYSNENGEICVKKVQSLFQESVNRDLTNEQIKNIFKDLTDICDDSIGKIGKIS